MGLSDIFKKEPIAWCTLLVTVLLAILSSNWFWGLFTGEVVATIYTAKTPNGRCEDVELIIENESDLPAYNIRAPVRVDNFALKDAYTPIYLSLHDLGIAPGESTYGPRMPDFKVPYAFDSKNLVLRIPKLNPGENLHVKYAEEVLDSELFQKRNDLIHDRYEPVMNKPEFGPITHDNGRIKVARRILHGCKR